MNSDMDVSLRSNLNFPKREERARNPLRKNKNFSRFCRSAQKLLKLVFETATHLWPDCMAEVLSISKGLPLSQWSRPRKALLWGLNTNTCYDFMANLTSFPQPTLSLGCSYQGTARRWLRFAGSRTSLWEEPVFLRVLQRTQRPNQDSGAAVERCHRDVKLLSVL